MADPTLQCKHVIRPWLSYFVLSRLGLGPSFPNVQVGIFKSIPSQLTNLQSSGTSTIASLWLKYSKYSAGACHLLIWAKDVFIVWRFLDQLSIIQFYLSDQHWKTWSMEGRWSCHWINSFHFVFSLQHILWLGFGDWSAIAVIRTRNNWSK